MVGQGVGHPQQRGVSCGMAEGVVHRLEAVEVEEHQAGHRVIAFAEGDAPLQLAHEGPPVERRGEGVAVGQQLDLGQPPVQPFDLGAIAGQHRAHGGRQVGLGQA